MRLVNMRGEAGGGDSGLDQSDGEEEKTREKSSIAKGVGRGTGDGWRHAPLETHSGSIAPPRENTHRSVAAAPRHPHLPDPMDRSRRGAVSRTESKAGDEGGPRGQPSQPGMRRSPSGSPCSAAPGLAVRHVDAGSVWGQRRGEGALPVGPPAERVGGRARAGESRMLIQAGTMLSLCTPSSSPQPQPLPGCEKPALQSQLGAVPNWKSGFVDGIRHRTKGKRHY